MAKANPGFTLIEVVISIVVVSMAMLAISTLFISNVATVTLAKAKTVGLALANQQMEYLRDLPYDSLATQNGTIYPPGTIPDDQTTVSGGYTFRIHTVINYVDDPYDGNDTGTIPNKPTDLYPYDYKQAEISVYLVKGNKRVAILDTNFSAKAAETSSNTGILSVKVIDANGNPIEDANVHIVNTVPNPDVNITTNTDSNGLVVIPKLPPDSNKNYQITASLGGYSTEMTQVDPVGAQTPVISNVNILVQQITNVTLAIDRVSTLNLHVVDTSGNPMTNFAITTTGSKQIYTSPTVYKYSQATSTDSSGNIALTNMEWDGYNFALPSGYYLVTSSPYSPVTLNPNSTQNVTLTVSNSATWPRLTTLTPSTGATGTNPVSITISGLNFGATATVVLQQAGQSNITATGVSVSGGKTITGALNLAGAATGSWDVVVTTNSHTITQTGGFNVSN